MPSYASGFGLPERDLLSASVKWLHAAMRAAQAPIGCHVEWPKRKKAYVISTILALFMS